MWYERAVVLGLIGITVPLIAVAARVAFRIGGGGDLGVAQFLVSSSTVVVWLGLVARVGSLILFIGAFRAGVGRRSTLVWMTCSCLLGESLLLADQAGGLIVLGVGVYKMLSYANLAALHRQFKRHVSINQALRVGLVVVWVAHFIATREGSTADPPSGIGSQFLVALVAGGLLTAIVVGVVMVISFRNARLNRLTAATAREAEGAFR